MASIKPMLEKDVQIQEQREEKYGGDHVPGHSACGMIWAALLNQYLGPPFEIKPLPAWLVETMMAGFKLCRAAEDPYDEDHFRDARVYLALAQDAASKQIEEPLIERIANGSESIR